eukprot:TRINITY_DN3168_c0_g1_i1.p1 TRINITY_DN3168_c0_g1~~TRINITY_DN3168_c0_g1_i1.p1  ORF type:complete len:575 (+),score=126.42 TRINITY_DN3168_c0_g1_i1:691-2415(+)
MEPEHELAPNQIKKRKSKNTETNNEIERSHILKEQEQKEEEPIHWRDYDCPAFSFRFPATLSPVLHDTEDKIEFAHKTLKEGDIIPYIISFGKEELKEPLDIKEYTQQTIKHMNQLIKENNITSNFNENLIKDLDFIDLPGKRVIYTTGDYTTFQVWTVDGFNSYTMNFQSPTTSFKKHKKNVFMEILRSFRVKEQNGWQNQIFTPVPVKEKPFSHIYIPNNWKEDEASMNLKFVFDKKKELGIKITLEIIDEPLRNNTSLDSLLQKRNIKDFKKITIGKIHDGIEYWKVDTKLFFVALFLTKTKKYEFIFKTHRHMNCAKTYLLWRSILDMFTLDFNEKDERSIYYNTYYKFGLRYPPPYHAISSHGKTPVKLWHQIKGHVYRVWCADTHSFHEKLNEENYVDFYKDFHLHQYKVSDKISDIKLAGVKGKEVRFEVQNVEVSSRLLLKNSFLYCLSCRTTNQDPNVQLFFIDFPIATYDEAKQISQSITELIKQTEHLQKAEPSKKNNTWKEQEPTQSSPSPAPPTRPLSRTSKLWNHLGQIGCSKSILIAVLVVLLAVPLVISYLSLINPKR